MPGMRVEVALEVPPRQRPATNLLTLNQASIETSAAGWFYMPGSPNLLERSDDLASDGEWSLKLTSTPGGSFWFADARITDPGQVVVWDYGSGPLQTGFVVSPGEFYCATADVRASAGTSGFAFVSLVFYETIPNGTFEFIDGTWQPILPGAWTQVRTIAEAPASAGWATMRVVTTNHAGPMYTDRMGLLEGGAGWVRPGGQPWTRIDQTDDPLHASPLRALTTTRGARMKIAEVEAGEAIGSFDNRHRALDPNNPVSPWAPHLKLRRRIRYVAETPEGDRPVFTGFIDRLPPAWHLGDATVNLAAVDLLALLGSDTITHSPFEQALLTQWPAPAHWWRLDEAEGRTARDAIGTDHGTWSADLSSQDPLLPFEGGRGNESFGSEQGKAWRPGQLGKVMTVPGFRGTGYPFMIDAWVRLTAPPVAINAGTNLWPNARLFHRRSIAGPSQEFALWIRWDNSPELHGRPFVRWTRSAGAPFELVNTVNPDSPTIADGNLHHIRVLVDVDPTTDEPRIVIWVDGIGAAAGYPGMAWPETPMFPSTLTLGLHNYVSSGPGFAGAGIVGHVTYWEGFDRNLPDPRPHALIDAALNAWRGETTGARIARVLDLVGIDPVDRDLDVGTEVVGPAMWKGSGVLDYLRRIVATEQGALFVDPAGRIRFRSRPPNDPPATTGFAGKPDPLDPAVVPYADLTPSYDLARMVNVAEVATDGPAEPERVEDSESVTEYGPISAQIDTAAMAGSQLRSIGSRLVARHREPRTVIEGIELAGRRDDVPVAATFDLELGDAVDIVGTPPGPGDPLEQRSLVERISHTFDYQAHDHRVSLGTSEVIVLPALQWDTPGRGWDRSVWP